MIYDELVNTMKNSLQDPKFRSFLPINLESSVPKEVHPGMVLDSLISMFAIAILHERKHNDS